MAYKNTRDKVRNAFKDELEKRVTIDEEVIKHDEDAPEEHKKGCGKCKKKNKDKTKSKKNGKSNK